MKRVAIVGLGLIGGSVALALKQLQTGVQVIGCSESAKDADAALNSGAIDEVADSPAAAAQGAELAVLATPPATLGELAGEICAADEAVIVTDTGSLKLPIAEAAQALPEECRRRIVPGHPIAGTEHSGFAAAFAELYRDCTVALTPAEDASDEAVALVQQFWRLLGASCLVTMDAAEHDALFAWSSHLPHLVAWALAATVTGNDRGEEMMQLSAGGLRDFTRIASSDPVLWSEIVHLNRDNLHEAMAGFAAIWQQLTRQVAADDEAPLKRFLRNTSRAARS